MNGSEAAELGAVAQPSEQKQDALILPLKSMTKRAIEESSEEWLNDMLEVYSAADLWVYIKQMEETAETLKAKLKTAAFDSIAQGFSGAMKGEVLTHEVSLSLPKKWIYSEDLVKFIEQQKKDLKARQAQEQADGSARQINEEGRITVKIREG